MDAGTVTEWRIKPGDQVRKGDIVAVVETQKADLEVEIFQEGVVDTILVPVGVKVPVGTLLATLRNGGTPARPVAPPVLEVTAPAGREPAPPQAVSAVPLASREAAEPGRVSPLARRVARELGVDLAGVRGTGAGETIVEADVRQASAAPGEAPGIAREEERQQAMRDAIGALMARSKREIPHYYLATDVDVSRLQAWLGEENVARGVDRRLIPAAALLKAVALAVADVPEMNGFWTDGGFQPSRPVHIGVAISLRRGGLIAPALHDVAASSLDQVMQGLLDLVGRTRSGRLRSSEMSDPTITVTNLGERGVETVFGVIYPPQVALVGFGRIAERPWASGGMVGARPVLTITLAADHRVSDGHRGALFLAAIARLLQEPEKL